jgi:hypothetical protein
VTRPFEDQLQGALNFAMLEAAPQNVPEINCYNDLQTKRLRITAV